MFFPHFASVSIKEWQVVLSSVEGTLLTGFFVLAPTITQENPTRKNFFWPFRQAVHRLSRATFEPPWVFPYPHEFFHTHGFSHTTWIFLYSLINTT